MWWVRSGSWTLSLGGRHAQSWKFFTVNPWNDLRNFRERGRSGDTVGCCRIDIHLPVSAFDKAPIGAFGDLPLFVLQGEMDT